MATIYDIAKLSGTSAATVSYVLNGKGDERHISKGTQERVLAAAERVNYRPNITARQLKKTGGQRTRIAALWPEFYFEQSMLSAIRAIKEVTRHSLEGVEVSMHFFMPGSLREFWDKFDPGSYNGLLLAGASLEDLDFIAGVERAVPIVLVNRAREGFPSVSVDHRQAGRLACDLATERGGQSVCAIWDARSHVATDLRRSGFAERCRELELDLSGSCYSCEGSADEGYALGQRLFQKGLLKKVIYCNNESVAQGVAAALNEAGVRVGEELFLLTANNGPDSFCRYVTPPLSCIDLRMQEVFENGLKLCLNLIVRHEGADTALWIPPRQVFRQSMPEGRGL